jgi:TPR repeat protein
MNQRSSQYSQGISDVSTSHAFYGDDIFIVANFPYPATQPYQEMLAHEAGYYTFTNVDDQVVTMHKLDYGLPCAKMWSSEELAAIKDRIEAPKKAAAAKALQSNQDAADKGDAYGLLRMGERYRDGEGLEKDLAKARDYLQKSADAGSPTAAEELKKLPDVHVSQQTTAP